MANGTITQSVQAALLGLFLFLSAQTTASEGGFFGAASPSRFELSGEAGSVIRRQLSLFNLGARPEIYTIRTGDWHLSSEGDLTFYDDLQPDSCRPWVRLERHEVRLLPSKDRPRKYRFEVHIPDNTPDQECRFTLFMESKGDPFQAEAGHGVRIPSTGRLAIIVYLKVGDAQAQSEVADADWIGKGEDIALALPITNHGNAHDRVQVELNLIQASGAVTPLRTSSLPILPGQTHWLELTSADEVSAPAEWAYPITVKGRVFSKEATFSVETQLESPL